MAKLTQKQVNDLLSILNRLTAAEKYLLSDNVAGIARPTKNPNGSSYTIVNPACVTDGVMAVDVVNHHYGSDLAQFYTAKEMLDKFIWTNGSGK